MTPPSSSGHLEQQVKLLLGEQMVQIVILNDALATANKKIEELMGKPEKPSLKAVQD